MPNKTDIIPAGNIEKKIMLIHGQKVMLDYDLAVLYGVETGALNRQVKRNTERFPDDFMVKLTPQDVTRLICQSSRPEESHPQSLTEPYLSLSTHTALIV